MRTLSDLITDIKEEIRQVPMQNAAVLTILGAEITEKVENMIGTHQAFWKDLASSTVDTKRRKGQGKFGDPSSPLYATGEFEKSVQYKLIGKNRVMIFSEADSAQYTELGTSKMPPRPVFKPAALIVLREWYAKKRLQGFYLKSLR